MEGMKDRAERMLENYTARLRVGQCGTRAGDIKGQAERYAAGVERTRRIRAATGAVLEAVGAPAILYPCYFSFASKLEKLRRRDWGEHAQLAEGRILLMTWQTRGLGRDVMLRIAREVFEMELAEDGN